MDLAHGLGGRSDLALPLWLALGGGVVALLVSFLALAVFWKRPRLRGARAGRPLPPRVRRAADAPATRRALRGLGLALFAVFLTVAWAGPDAADVNPAPTWFYVWFWVGLVPASLLFGPVWRLLNPLRTLAAGLALVRRGRPPRPAPDWLGPAAAVTGLLAFLWLELVYDHSESPRAVAAFVPGYALLHTVAGAVFGPRWFGRADGFEAYSSLVAAAAPFGRRADGTLVLRDPFDGLAALPRSRALTANVLVLLGSTAFDGLTRTPVWSDLIRGTARAPYLLLGTAGLLGCVAAVTGVYVLAVRVSLPYLRRSPHPYTEFSHSLIPIAIGYTVAHYFSFALFQGQQGVLLANDPFGRGWNLLGTQGERVDYLLVSTTAIAWTQIAAIVLGHVAGVASAHDRAVRLMPRRHAGVGQFPLLAAMIGYTTAGIALLAGV
ncbi:hypothetical protein [Streptomyces specialis]|uniref:hypothetical protein n=1 Tax=Streptomyces specialis TaxID=498367 RepID=UPI00073ECA3E|nr:hypothetical protein [Streptomyces specialis]